MRSLKKNLQNKLLRNPKKELYFFDESRFGTHSKLGYGWFEKGKRVQIKSKLGFKSLYLYSAVNVRTGEDITLIIPNVNTICMNIFLEKMSEIIGDKEVYLVMDCAGWHKSSNLKVPSNIEIIFLPPYSPELNPVERFWQHIKDCIMKNTIYENLDDIENAICIFFRGLKAEVTKSVCSLNYLST